MLYSDGVDMKIKMFGIGLGLKTHSVKRFISGKMRKNHSKQTNERYAIECGTDNFRLYTALNW